MPAARWPLLASHLEGEHGVAQGVGLVVGVFLLDQELVAGELLGPVALLAGLAGRAELVDGARDGPGIGPEGHREDLAHPGELRLHEPPGPGSDVALHAAHPRMRRVHEGGVLGGHDRVAGEAAELRGVQVLHALVGGRAHDGHVQDRDSSQEEQGVANDRGLEVHPRVLGGELPLHAQPAAPPQQPERDEGQAEGEDRGQDHEEQDPEVGMDGPLARELEQPEPHQGDSGRRGEGRSHQADRVVSEVDGQPAPVPKAPRSCHAPSSEARAY